MPSPAYTFETFPIKVLRDFCSRPNVLEELARKRLLRRLMNYFFSSVFTWVKAILNDNLIEFYLIHKRFSHLSNFRTESRYFYKKDQEKILL